ncbi:MAG: DUF7544 domain-containing protein [Planctomycetota bacterium]
MLQRIKLHCVAENKGEVVKPWKQYAQQANSLFLFKVILSLLGTVASLVFIVPLVFIIISFAKTDFKIFAAAGVVPAIFIALGFIVLVIALTVVNTLTKDFVVPIMRLGSCTVTEGWRRFWALCKPNIGTFVLFLLFLIAVNIVLGIIALIVVVGACCLCCVGIIFMIPYIGTVAMLPLIVWRRAYSALFLAQFGPEFDVFVPEVTPVVVPTAEIPPVPPCRRTRIFNKCILSCLGLADRVNTDETASTTQIGSAGFGDLLAVLVLADAYSRARARAAERHERQDHACDGLFRADFPGLVCDQPL